MGFIKDDIQNDELDEIILITKSIKFLDNWINSKNMYNIIAKAKFILYVKINVIFVE